MKSAHNSSLVHFRFTSDSIRIQFTLEVPIPISEGIKFIYYPYNLGIRTSLSICRLQLITTTLVDLNYC
ncbi:hypothetical protein VN97_g2639 [Penicillium thymicola]|uniref:Uncharacterized protein n=1 Tax=Penicillium thymicola TaxID=293382 RepID=A0AAI9TNV0_PENTH|nr:hypothetical protein VN97_g2639 [Penicillium thymicola]